MKKPAQNDKPIAENRRARSNYTVLDTFECGIVLKGSEVKSLRAHKVSFSDSYALIKDGEVLVIGLRIDRFDKNTHDIIDPDRTRKLLLHKKEIVRIERILKTKNATLVPLKIYLKNGLVKVLVGIGIGKSKSDKRDTIKEREAKIEVSRALKRG